MEIDSDIPVWTLGNGVLGRADLVRMVYRAHSREAWPSTVAGKLLTAGMPLAVAAEFLGLSSRVFEQSTLPSTSLGIGTVSASVSPPMAATLTVESQPSLSLWRVVGPVLKLGQEASRTQAPEWLRQGEHLKRLGSTGEPAREPRPLLPPARMGCVLRQHVRRIEQGKRIDERRLVVELSRARLLRELPREQHRVWPRRLQVYWDRSSITALCWSDQFRVYRWLKLWRGAQNLELIFADGLGPSQRWVGRRWQPVLSPDSQTTVLAMTDLGAADGDGERAAFWANLGRRAAEAGARTVALVLCPSSRWPAGLAQSWHALDWERARPFRLPGHAGERGSGRDQAKERELVEKLMALLSPTLRVEPGLLREARDLLRPEGASFATELDFWLDSRVESRSRDGAALSQESRHMLRREYLRQPEAQRRGLEVLLERHHARLSPLILSEELFACRHDSEALQSEDSNRPLESAQQIFAQYARRLAAQGMGSNSEALWIDRWSARQSEETWRNEHVATIWALAHLNEDSSAFTTNELPHGLNLDQIAFALHNDQELRWVCLWQHGEELRFEAIGHREMAIPEGPGFVLARFPLRHSQVQIFPVEEALSSSRSILININERQMLPLQLGHDLRFESDSACLTLVAETLPLWASAIRRDRDGLWVTTEVAEFDWIADNSHGTGIVQDVPTGRVHTERNLRERTLFWPQWAKSLTRDEYGLLATLELSSRVSMRLRWVSPGRFLMGSSKTESGRHDDEGPQCWVELTRGFWLGESPCTQLQWETEMGENPSEFKGANRPVERVSWEDCRRFCSQLRTRVAGLSARLPTEAEWEYACRAGTTSAYNDGSDSSTPDGMAPSLAALGWFDENSKSQTHEVMQLKANAWGFHDMHGNVWEWCQDWYTNYNSNEQRPPTSTMIGGDRVMRGGSWGCTARFCRSAQRLRYAPADRWNFLGFRLAADHVPAQAVSATGSAESLACEREAWSGQANMRPTR